MKKNKKETVDSLIEDYNLLAKDVKFQVGPFIFDHERMDFDYLKDTLNQLKRIQKKIRRKNYEELINKNNIVS